MRGGWKTGERGKGEFMKTDSYDAIVFSSSDEKGMQQELTRLMKNVPIPDDELLANLGLFLTSKNLSRILFFSEIYKRIINNHGVIMEFGTRWGQTMSLMASLRGIFEPFNRHRQIIGFDTFEGHKGITELDATPSRCSDGSFTVSPGYDEYLARIINIQEGLNPVNHIRKHEIIRGDAVKTIPAWFDSHPEALVSLAVLDFDIYAPTKAALEAIKPRLFKGSIIVFDELCDSTFPGETVAFREVFSPREFRIQRLPMTSRVCFMEVE